MSRSTSQPAYGVSRHTLRAALRRLAREAIVVVEPHRGARVASLGSEQLVGLLELREVEADAARARAARGPAAPTVHAAAPRLSAACGRARLG